MSMQTKNYIIIIQLVVILALCLVILLRPTPANYPSPATNVPTGTVSNRTTTTDSNSDTNMPDTNVTNFQECLEAGYPIMESYPRKCRDNEGNTYTEFIGNELEKQDLIQLDNPRPNQEISSPLTITGKARGTWFFEGTFPISLTNWDGLIIGESYATAQDEWMTEEFVPFSATIEFEKPDYKENGTLILQKDNPSGLPENDDALEIPVYFK